MHRLIMDLRHTVPSSIKRIDMSGFPLEIINSIIQKTVFREVPDAVFFVLEIFSVSVLIVY